MYAFGGKADMPIAVRNICFLTKADIAGHSPALSIRASDTVRCFVRQSGVTMRRREFIRLVGGAVAWPLTASAQQLTMPVIGYMSARSPEDTVQVLKAF